ncbi:MAG: CoA-binding protein [Leptospiraceae bacterium]|nr:CoA-binding protein [Leptospiraceae bacterium]
MGENKILELLDKKGKDLKIALVGATNDSRKYGNIIYKDLKSKGIKVFGINNKATTIDGDIAYHNVEDLENKPDIINFVVPPKIGFEIVKKLNENGYDNFWFQPGAESDEIINYLETNKKNYLAYACVMVKT